MSRKILFIFIMLMVFSITAIPSMAQGPDCADNYTVQADDWLSKLTDRYFGNIMAYPAIVDATNVNLGRDPLALKRISLATGLNIIMGSGYYTEKGQDLDLMDKRNEEDIAEEIVQDIYTTRTISELEPGL